MEQGKYIPLEEIFNLQDRVLKRAIENHKAEWVFVRDCIELVINRRFIGKNISKSDENKLEIVHTFLNDAISTLINSLKIGLYGCYADALTLLRPVIEELTIIDHIVGKGVFQTADYELDRNFKKLKFDEIVNSVKDSQVIKELHGRISNVAVHGTATRIRKNSFDLNGTNMPTVGVALDPERTKKYLHEIMRASLYMIRILTDFYSTKPEIISEYFFVKKEELEKRFSAFRSLGKSKIPQ